MRYLKAENPYILARFASGATATITIRDLSDDSTVVNAASMSEIGTTGWFKYRFTTVPSSLSFYFYLAVSGTDEHAGVLVKGGYTDSIVDDLGNPDQFKADVSGVASDASLARKVLTNRQVLSEGASNNLITYDDDDTTTLMTQSVSDKDGNDISLGEGDPARRSKGA